MSDIKPESYLYLASPYSHENMVVRNERARIINGIGFKLIRLGLNLFCPITQSHNLNKSSGPNIPDLSHDECMRVDYAFLSRASGLIVVKLDGWNESKGVALEMDYAIQHKMPIYMLEEDDNLEEFAKSIKEGDVKFYQCGKIIPEDNREVDKGASKEGKPSIMNFPWAGYHGPIGSSMESIITDTLGRNYDNLEMHTIELLRHLETMYKTDDVEVNEVFTKGGIKHGLRTHLNYTKYDLELLVNALGRHILKGLTKEDEETGLKHVLHAEANLLMILQALRRGD